MSSDFMKRHKAPLSGITSYSEYGKRFGTDFSKRFVDCEQRIRKVMGNYEIEYVPRICDDEVSEISDNDGRSAKETICSTNSLDDYDENDDAEEPQPEPFPILYDIPTRSVVADLQRSRKQRQPRPQSAAGATARFADRKKAYQEKVDDILADILTPPKSSKDNRSVMKISDSNLRAHKQIDGVDNGMKEDDEANFPTFIDGEHIVLYLSSKLYERKVQRNQKLQDKARHKSLSSGEDHSPSRTHRSVSVVSGSPRKSPKKTKNMLSNVVSENKGELRRHKDWVYSEFLLDVLENSDDFIALEISSLFRRIIEVRIH